MTIMGHHGMAGRCSLLLDPGPAFAMTMGKDTQDQRTMVNLHG